MIRTTGPGVLSTTWLVLVMVSPTPAHVGPDRAAGKDEHPIEGEYEFGTIVSAYESATTHAGPSLKEPGGFGFLAIFGAVGFGALMVFGFLTALHQRA